jgi:hypothetical protein
MLSSFKKSPVEQETIGCYSIFQVGSLSNIYKKKCVSDGDFQKTKGVRSEQPIVTDKICGFRNFDKVQYFGIEYFIKGRMSTGYAILMDVDGNKVDFGAMPRGYKAPKLSNCKRIAARSTVITQAKEV